MTKQKKLWIIIISCILAVALITTAVILIVANANREKTETSILTCSVNPQVQFVLNGNDKVMNVVALNSEGQEIAVNGNFVGLRAEKAVELFVKLSTEAGYIEVDTEGTRVEFNLTGIKNDYVQLKNKIVTSVNKYFDNQGIIAGAVVEIDKDIKEAILTLKSTAQNMDNKSNKELIAHYVEITELIDGVKASNLEAFYNGYDQAVTTYKNAMADIEEAIADFESQLANTTLPAEVTRINNLISNLKNKETNSAFNAYTTTISNLYKLLKTTEAEINSMVTTFESHVTAHADEIQSHFANYNANKAEITQKIADFRATLTN